MHFSTILPAIAAVLGAVNAAAFDDSEVEPRAPNCPLGIELLRLTGFPKNTGTVFTGVGKPGDCKFIPRNVRDFGKAEELNGFQCIIYEKFHCQTTGNTLEVGDGKKKFKGSDGPWRSYRCACPTH
ncbi:hypothetical protein B0J13DRAFT_531320 [Dactylonectria estremocensis]|uniref:SSCRP protein n=1 Tax=Dactylonectria estremocensis TaxID=1079267 RepID=A0A9P9DSS2_9HYPO|nr:hypothetical protein B0J13DRAFT_531320 [Dactylonectria estremocensis]